MNAFDSIIGYESIKKELMQISDTVKNTEVYSNLGVSAPRGLLLYGEPGVGKSHMARAVMEECGRKTFTLRKDRPDGEFIAQIKQTFDLAVKEEPSVVFLDDMDKFADGDERHPDKEEYVTIQSCIEETKGHRVFVLATVNTMDNLPRSLRRAGRFDRVIKVDPPTGEDAEKIIEHYLSKKTCVKDVDARTVAHILNGRSCAELETVINEAGLIAGYRRDEAITMDHIINACLRTVFDVPAEVYDDDEVFIDDDDLFDRNALFRSEVLLNQIVWHEAGHAVVSEVLCPGCVTLVCAHDRRGRSGGFTHYYNDGKNSVLHWLKKDVIGALGGMAAVEHVYGIRDAGCSSDLRHAFDRVRDLMSNECVNGFPLYSYGSYRDSEDAKRRQEVAAAAEVEKYYLKAKEILALNGEFFGDVAEALARKGVLSAADIRDIRSNCKIVSVSI